MKYNTEIPGWMSIEDLEVISLLAGLVPDNGKILEIGSWCGRSTSALWCSKPSTATLEIIDTFVGFRPENIDKLSISGSTDLLSDAIELARKNSHWLDSFKLCVGDTIFNDIKINVTESAKFQINHNYDLIFIDADHNERSVISDIRKYSLNPNALLVGDDFSIHWSGVPLALTRLAPELGRTLVIPGTTKIWIMLPIGGYWDTKTFEIFDGIRQIVKHHHLTHRL